MQAFIVVVIYIIFDHFFESISIGESFSIVSLSLQNSPKAFHWSIVDILYKPGELTKEEYKIVQQHTVIGHDMIMNSNLNRELKKYAAEIALHHHERIDGSGYPDNLLGKEIKDWIQVVALADVYTALRSKRVYKPAYSKEKAVQIILDGGCGEFPKEYLTKFQEYFRN